MIADDALAVRPEGRPSGAAPSRESLGVALVFSGLPLAWITRYATGGGDSLVFSLALLLLGLSLIVNWHRLLSGRLHGNATLLAPPVLFLVIAMLFAALSSNESLLESGYMAFSLAFLVCCLTPDLDRLKGLPATLVVVAALVGIGTLLQWIYMPVVPISPEDTGTSRLYAGDSNNPNAVAFVAGAGLIGALWEAATERRLARWWAYVACASFCVVILIFTGTRSAIAGLLACAAIVVTSWLFHGAVRRNAARRRWGPWPLVLAFRVLLVIGLLVAVVPSAVLDVLSEKSTDLVERTVLGIEGLTSEEGGAIEESADIRRDLRQEAIAGLSFFGQGYGTLYIDFPLLHVYYELGVVPGTLFFVAALALPLALCLRSWYGSQSDSLPRFVALLYIFFLPNIGVHGKPYDFTIWIPILMVYATMGRNGVWK